MHARVGPVPDLSANCIAALGDPRIFPAYHLLIQSNQMLVDPKRQVQ